MSRLQVLIWFFVAPLLAPAQDPAKERQQMVTEQIERRGVKDRATLASMRKVPRHLFVPASQVAHAYEDRPLPIGHGQTISQPYIVAYMTETAKPAGDHRVLEIGTGSGYQAAVIAGLVKEVYTIEIVEPLASQAAKRLRDLKYQNIEVRTGDGYFGWKDKAPFDIILVTAAAEHIPPALTAQLKEGGRMVIPVGSPFMVQQLMLVEKTGGRIRTKSLMPVRFVPFTRSE